MINAAQAKDVASQVVLTIIARPHVAAPFGF
jgi:hypothetical protein